jgi:hypothetical protein
MAPEGVEPPFGPISSFDRICGQLSGIPSDAVLTILMGGSPEPEVKIIVYHLDGRGKITLPNITCSLDDFGNLKVESTVPGDQFPPPWSGVHSFSYAILLAKERHIRAPVAPSSARTLLQ